MVICSDYKPNILHLFVPPFTTLVKLCLSIDKTNLFLTTFLRFVFYLTLFVGLYVGGLMTLSYETPLQFSLTIMLITIVILSMFSVILVLIKRPVYNIDFLRRQTNSQYRAIKKDLGLIQQDQTRETGIQVVQT